MFGNLVLLDKSNTRKSTSGQKRVLSYDLNYSVKTSKFALTEAASERLDIQNNGLSLFPDYEGKKAYFGVAASEDSILLRGRAGSKKARTFKAEKVREAFNEVGMVGNRFKLVDTEQSYTHGKITYRMFEIVPVVLSADEEAEAKQQDAEDEIEGAEGTEGVVSAPETPVTSEVLAAVEDDINLI